jgi:tetratricopeptide (TPR) repeat protein
LGWIHQETKAWEAAWALAVRDEQAGRLSPVWQARLALLHGQRGQFNQAEGLVEAAYAADPNLKDGYGRLGLIKAENTDWAGAVELVRKDQALNRQSPSSAVDESLAQLYGRLALTRKADDKDREWANFEQETEEVVSQAFPYIKLAVSNAVLNHKQIWQCCIPKSASTYLHRILNTLWKQDCCLGTSVPYFRDRMQEPEVYTVFQRIKNSQKPYFSGHLHQKYTTYLHQFFLSKQSELLGGVIVQTRDLKDTIVSIKEHTDRVCLEGQVGPWIVTAPSLWPNRLPTTPT